MIKAIEQYNVEVIKKLNDRVFIVKNKAVLNSGITFGFYEKKLNIISVLVGISYLEWDSKHFSLNMFKLNLVKLSENYKKNKLVLSKIKEYLLAKYKNKIHISIEVPLEKMDAIELLSTCGFEVLEKKMYFSWERGVSLSPPRFIQSVKPALNQHFNEIRELSSLLNFQTRFTNDSTLDQKLVKSMYMLWIEKSLNDENTIKKVYINNSGVVAYGCIFTRGDAINTKNDITYNSNGIYISNHNGKNSYPAILFSLIYDSLKSQEYVQTCVSSSSHGAIRALNILRAKNHLSTLCLRYYLN